MKILQLGPALLQPLPQAEGGEHRPARVVLVSDGGSEERHEAVAEELVDRPLVAVDLPQGELEELVEQEMHRLRPHPLGKGGRAHEVAEEDGDLLALAFEGGTGLEDLVR